jgi:hypothetical protein
MPLGVKHYKPIRNDTYFAESTLSKLVETGSYSLVFLPPTAQFYSTFVIFKTLVGKWR